MVNHSPTVKINGFKGINNVLKPENTSSDFYKKAVNVDIDKSFRTIKRQGYSQIDNGDYSSIWSNETNTKCYAIKDGNLVSVSDNLAVTILKVGVGNFKMSFEEVNSKVYFSSININGIIEDNQVKEWGLPMCTLSPNITITSGTMPEGSYLINFTYVNSEGLESGCPESIIQVIPNNSSISINIPSVSDISSDIVFIKIYCSTPNGNTLYLSGITTPNTTYKISDVRNLINPLRTFNLDRAPLGKIIKYYKGRIFIAHDNVLYYSEPLMYNHFDLSKNFLVFPKDIQEVMPVEDGIWIASDGLHYITGSKPEEFKSDLKEYVKVVEGTAVKFSGSYLKLDNIPTGYKWFVTTNLGIFILMNQGFGINMTATNFNINEAEKGSGVFLQQRGMNHYLTMLNTNSKINNGSFQDLVETKIIRNGITITN